ncbi:S-adenosyl-L-methionine-dependent methyltransferase [Gigaspora rosea]|uniref:S-adenosyl-L-methionine-dependent methyltransferase n=1 Tax=Gigaspora rosea TaxID=44941 RepID=A0A397VHR8_9GLOM|nr:S-adenosyl-L-methionine-dependent methyltransferase [Gigaspora rosea]
MGAQNSKHEKISPVIESLDSEAHEQFRYLLGRRFHNVSDIIYDLPNDEDEADRLHLEHFLTRDVWKTNFLSPIAPQLEVGCKVLDVGCGPGTWTIEMAMNYDKSSFVGIDISPIFPMEIKPSNVNFKEANILDEIPYPDESFDFVHMRYMFPSFTQMQWEEIVMNEIVRVIKIGGWLELCEYELCQNCGPVLESLLSARREMLIKEGRNPEVARILGKLMENTQHFDDVCHKTKEIPIGPWAGKIGEVGRDNIVTRMIGIKPALSLFMNITTEQYDEMMQKSIEEFNEYKTFFVTSRWYAKKKVKTTT